METPTTTEIAGYVTRQQTFIDENGLKIGDTVKITRKAEDWEEGWNNVWVPGMAEAFDNVGTIENFGDNGIGIEIKFDDTQPNHFMYPYFIIEKA